MVSRTCHVHIGMMKTGTTTIQAAFEGYDDGRLHYLPYSMRNHSTLMRNVFKPKPAPNLPLIAEGMVGDEFDKRVEADRQWFDAALTANDLDLLISAEELTSSFTSADVNKLVARLRDHFDHLRVVAYAREPVAYMTSILQQRTKTRAVSFAVDDLYPDYRRQFGKWDDAVGPEHVRITKFARSELAGGDLLTDFAGRVGADLSRLNEVNGRMNESLPARGFALLYLYRQARGGPRSHPMLAKNNQRVVRLLRDFGGPPVVLAPEKCAAVLDANRDDIRWIEARMGRPFDPPVPAGGDLTVIGTEDDIRQLAADAVPELAEFLARRGRTVPDRAGIVELMDLAYGFVPDEPLSGDVAGDRGAGRSSAW